MADSEPKVSSLHRIARVCAEHMQVLPMVEQTLEKQLTVAPADTQSLDALAHYQVAALERKLENVNEDGHRRAILLEIADILEKQIAEADGAISALRRVLEIDPGDRTALDSLERMYRAESCWHELVAVLQRKIELSADPMERAALTMCIGDLLEAEISNPIAAVDCFRAVLDVHPNHLGAIASLERLYANLERWAELLQMWEIRIGLIKEPQQQVELLAHMAQVWESNLNSPRDAVKALERAFEIAPTRAQTIASLERLLKDLGDWDRFSKVVCHHASLLSDADAIEAFWLNIADVYEKHESQLSDPRSQSLRQYRIGGAYDRAGNRERALEHYRQALAMDPTNLYVLEDLSQALLAVRQWEEAQTVLSTILMLHRNSLVQSEVGNVERHLGEICLRSDQPELAYEYFERALMVNPHDPHALRALATIDEHAGAYELALNRLKALVDAVPRQERVQVLVKMSEIAHAKLHDVGRAMMWLDKAHELGPLRSDTLEQFARVALALGAAPMALEAVKRALAGTSEPRDLSKLNCLLGSIYENEIKDEEAAVKSYNDSLDAVSTNIKAFRAIERILSNRRQWASLERNYRRVLNRTRDLSPQARTVVWRNLAELYRVHLGQLDEAITAYEVVRKLDRARSRKGSSINRSQHAVNVRLCLISMSILD